MEFLAPTTFKGYKILLPITVNIKYFKNLRRQGIVYIYNNNIKIQLINKINIIIRVYQYRYVTTIHCCPIKLSLS